MTVDFLIAPSRADDKPGSRRDIEEDFAAIIAPGLHLAFVDQQRVRVEGKTIMGETAARDVQLAGPAAFVVLKALAFKNRGENKDAYDLFYLVRHFGSGIDDVVARFRPLLEAHADAQEALAVLKSEFAELDCTGPRRVAEFLLGGPDEDLQADVRGLVLDFVARCEAGSDV